MNKCQILKEDTLENRQNYLTERQNMPWRLGGGGLQRPQRPGCIVRELRSFEQKRTPLFKVLATPLKCHGILHKCHGKSMFLQIP